MIHTLEFPPSWYNPSRTRKLNLIPFLSQILWIQVTNIRSRLTSKCNRPESSALILLPSRLMTGLAIVLSECGDDCLDGFTDSVLAWSLVGWVCRPVHAASTVQKQHGLFLACGLLAVLKGSGCVGGWWTSIACSASSLAWLDNLPVAASALLGVVRRRRLLVLLLLSLLLLLRVVLLLLVLLWWTLLLLILLRLLSV